MGSKVLNISGQRYGKLRAIRCVGMAKNGKAMASLWLCECDCGLSREAIIVELRRGRIVSCGCQSKTRLKDLTGVRFGYWTAVRLSGQRKGVRTAWLCSCVCGTERDVQSLHLLSGASQSCGCMRPKGIDSATYKHGSDHEAYRTWSNMLDRCRNPNNPAWHLYGGKGVTVCDAWATDFLQFAEDMGPKPSRNHSIDRKNGNGNYEPGNCRWATAKEQARNMSRNRIVDFEGRRVTLAEACELSGVNYDAAKDRDRKGRDWRGQSHA